MSDSGSANSKKYGILWAIVGVIVAIGVLLPLGIASWNSVCDHRAIMSAGAEHEARGDKAFAAGDYQVALAAWARARGSRDSLQMQTKIARARLFLVATRPDLLTGRDIADIDYERNWLSAVDPANEATYKVVQGHLTAFKGDVEAAIKIYDEVVAKDKENPGAHLGLAIQAYRKGDSKKAQEEFSAVLAKIPSHIEALIGMGDMLLSASEADQAIENYNKALKVQEDPRAHHGLGLALTQKKDTEKAAAEFTKAIALNPQAFDSYVALGNLLSGAGALAQAERAFRAALQLRQDEGVILGLARVLNKMNRFQEAFQVLAVVLQTRSAGPGIILEAGKALEGAGRKDDARAYFAEVEKAVGQLGERLDKKVGEDLIKEARAALERLGPAPAPAPEPEK